MILSKLAGTALIVSISTGSVVAPNGDSVRHLSPQQKNAAIQSLARFATECIARNVAANPGFRGQSPDLGNLIVASVPRCVVPVRAMIDAYDRFFGNGAGEAFFMGPYLDALPAAVNSLAADSAD